jgi:hypothetical protein
MIRIAIGTLAAGVVLVIAPAAATITCQSSPPRGVAASYRTIEGRKCWYAGRHHIDKAQLAWRREAHVLPPKRELDPAAETSDIEITGSIDPSFEARWQTLAPVDWASDEAKR